jgi:excisionase family DNA binding protein
MQFHFINFCIEFLIFKNWKFCKYIGVSESLLYKLTAAKEVPHYKPRGKMLYFNREEIDKWLLQNKQEVIGMVTKIEIDNPKE